MLTALEFRLLNDFQRRFPLVPRPYEALARALDESEEMVIATLARLHGNGMVSRVGAVVRPGSIGATTLAAVAAPPQRLLAVASLVSDAREVNHNYEREHAYNLWFVAGAADEARLAATLARIERRIGLEVLAMPLIEEYHIDLGFRLDGGDARDVRAPRAPTRAALDQTERELLAALEEGLPLVPQPYAAIGERLGLTEAAVIERLAAWQSSGLIRRLGVIVRHHELGYRANAMAVWDVPDETVAQFGCALARQEGVTLAYRRARCLPQWGYNLYCMIHGVARTQVVARLASIGRETGLSGFPHEVLFSRNRFKQTGARVASATTEAAHG